MTDITDSMARYIDNIPDGAVHTCSDLCIKTPCLIVRGKLEIERLRAERDEAVARLAEAERDAERDAERLTWVESIAGFTIYRGIDPETRKPCGHVVFVDETGRSRRGILGESIRAAIDAAMKEGK